MKQKIRGVIAVFGVLGALISTNAAALTGGPDAFGNTFTDSTEAGGPTYNFIDISGTGTNIGAGDDTNTGPIALGFTFNFYGTDYTDYFIDSNGYQLMGAGAPSDFPNEALDAGWDGSPANIVAPLWDDWAPPARQRGVL